MRGGVDRESQVPAHTQSQTGLRSRVGAIPILFISLLLAGCAGEGSDPNIAKPSTCHGNNSACVPAPPPSTGGMATLLWNANTELDLAGYRVYYGFASGAETVKVEVGNAVSAVLGPFQLGLTVFAVVTAYDFSGNESVHSVEVSKVIS
jgi:hypothetical protein